MPALPPKADMCSAASDVCFGPIVDINGFRPDNASLQSLHATGPERSSRLRVIGRRHLFHALLPPFGDTLGHRKCDAVSQRAGLTNKWGTGSNDFSRPFKVRLGNLYCHAPSMYGQSLIF